MCCAVILNCCDNLGSGCAAQATGLCPELPTCLPTARQCCLERAVRSTPASRWGRLSALWTQSMTHTDGDQTRLSCTLFYLSTVTEKTLRNSTIAFYFCVSLFPSTPAHFYSLEISHIAHTLARAGGVGTVLPK